eukprot:2758805-Rhodomonas_salina.1
MRSCGGAVQGVNDMVHFPPRSTHPRCDARPDMGSTGTRESTSTGQVGLLSAPATLCVVPTKQIVTDAGFLYFDCGSYCS